MLTGVKTWTSEVLVLGSFKLWQRSKIDSNYKYFICFILNQKCKQEDKSNVKNVFLDMIKLLYKGKELLFDPKGIDSLEQNQIFKLQYL